MKISETPKRLRVIINNINIHNMTNLQETSVKNLDIKKELCFDSVIIKLYNVPSKCRCNRNIVGENKKGELIWQVKDVNPSLDSPFTNIDFFDKERIIAHNWLGADYYVDIRTGIMQIVNRNSRIW